MEKFNLRGEKNIQENCKSDGPDKKLKSDVCDVKRGGFGLGRELV